MYVAYLPQILIRTVDQHPHYAQGCCHAVLSWPGLVRQVLPSRQAGIVVGWLVPMARSRSSPGEGRMVLQTIVLPRICSSSRAASAARNRRSSSLAAHCSNSSRAAAAKSISGTATVQRGAALSSSSSYSTVLPIFYVTEVFFTFAKRFVLQNYDILQILHTQARWV